MSALCRFQRNVGKYVHGLDRCLKREELLERDVWKIVSGRIMVIFMKTGKTGELCFGKSFICLVSFKMPITQLDRELREVFGPYINLENSIMWTVFKFIGSRKFF